MTVTVEDMDRAGRTPADFREEAAWVSRLGRYGARTMVVVALLALVFTMVNVQLFAAAGHSVASFEWWIAWLLDPMASITMGAAIVFEGILADYERRETRLNVVKWFAGLCTWAMNIWASAAAMSAAGVLLHSVAPGLVLLLAEAAPRVRRQLAEIAAGLERQAAESDRAHLAAERAAYDADLRRRRVDSERDDARRQRELADRREAREHEARQVVGSLAAVLGLGAAVRRRPPSRPRRTSAPIPRRLAARRPTSPASIPVSVPVTEELLSQARRVRSERASQGKSAGRAVLQRELGVPETTARDLVRRLGDQPLRVLTGGGER